MSTREDEPEPMGMIANLPAVLEHMERYGWACITLYSVEAGEKSGVECLSYVYARSTPPDSVVENSESAATEGA